MPAGRHRAQHRRHWRHHPPRSPRPLLQHPESRFSGPLGTSTRPSFSSLSLGSGKPRVSGPAHLAGTRSCLHDPAHARDSKAGDHHGAYHAAPLTSACRPHRHQRGARGSRGQRSSLWIARRDRPPLEVRALPVGTRSRFGGLAPGLRGRAHHPRSLYLFSPASHSLHYAPLLSATLCFPSRSEPLFFPSYPPSFLLFVHHICRPLALMKYATLCLQYAPMPNPMPMPHARDRRIQA